MIIKYSTIFALPGIAFTTVLAVASEQGPPQILSKSVILIRDVTIVDADTAALLPHRTVTVSNDHIERIEPATSKAPTLGAYIVEGSGKYLIPGLVDGHVHLATQRVFENLINSRDVGLKTGRLSVGPPHSFDRRLMLQFLLNGVTTVVSFGSLAPGTGDDLELRNLIASGDILGPQLLVGDLVDGATADHESEAPSTIESPRTAADGRSRVIRAKELGYDFIKPYTYLNKATFSAVVNTAHELNLKAIGHLPELGCADCATRADAFATPLDGIAHLEELGTYAISSDLDLRDATELADLVKKQRQAVITTLITKRNIVQMYAFHSVPLPPPCDLQYVDSLLLSRWLGPKNRYLGEPFRHQTNAAMIPATFDFERIMARELWKRDVPLVVGTDTTIPGVAYGSSVPEEMIELNKVGLPPGEVLKAATQNAFRLLGRADRSGTISVGQRADLILLRANPLDYVGNVRQIMGVMASGRWFPIERLRRMADVDARYYSKLDRQLGITRPFVSCLNTRRDR